MKFKKLTGIGSRSLRTGRALRESAGAAQAGSDSPARRRYQDSCAAAHALDLVGERWALLVMRELMFGPRRFSDLRAALPGISANVLTQRLQGLEASGVVERRRLPPPASVPVYGLTRWGLQSEPIFQALGRWAVLSPAHDLRLPLSPSSLMLSLRTMFVAEQARGVDLTVRFVIGEEVFVARVRRGSLSVAREAGMAEGDAADLTFTGPAQAAAAAIHGKVPLPVLAEAGELAVAGQRNKAEKFVSLFAFPKALDGG